MRSSESHRVIFGNVRGPEMRSVEVTPLRFPFLAEKTGQWVRRSYRCPSCRLRRAVDVRRRHLFKKTKPDPLRKSDTLTKAFGRDTCNRRAERIFRLLYHWIFSKRESRHPWSVVQRKAAVLCCKKPQSCVSLTVMWNCELSVFCQWLRLFFPR